ncbi:MAG: DUF4926 domain-containing protein, partial [Burkholderiales bacterium]
MIGEHDSVVLTKDLPSSGLIAGDVGVVVHVYPGGGEPTEPASHRVHVGHPHPGLGLSVADLHRDAAQAVHDAEAVLV